MSLQAGAEAVRHQGNMAGLSGDEVEAIDTVIGSQAGVDPVSVMDIAAPDVR